MTPSCRAAVHNFKDFIGFPNVGKANLVNTPMPRLRHLWFDKFRNGFDAIRERDVLLYYPYHTFEHVLELLRRRPRSIPACWRSKSTSTAWQKIPASSDAMDSRRTTRQESHRGG